MKTSSYSDLPLKFKLTDIVSGNIDLPISLQSSFIRNCNVTDMATEEKYALFFSIVNQSSNAVVITDDNKRIVYVNKKFEEISGYSLQEVLGKNPNILRSNKTPKETYNNLYVALKEKKTWKGEFINIHRNGSQYIEEATISPITNAKGEVLCYLGEKKDITVQKESERIIKKLTFYDSLTEVPNRAYFMSEVERLTHLPQLISNYFSVLFIDLNRFKKLNDTYGHLCGDIALKTLAKRIEELLSPDDFVARIGGDEFVVIHNHATESTTSKLVKQIEQSFSLPIYFDNQENYLSASIGSAMWPKDGSTRKEILSRADLAMYNAKLCNYSYTAYTNDIGYRYNREFELTRKLGIAIQENLLSLVYQPKVNLTTGQISGVEALLRWNDPELGSISPMEFIPIAEKYKMMNAIGNWVIFAVCKQIHQWDNEKQPIVGRVAINISVQQIENNNFYENLLSITSAEKVSPERIELEVTESLLISNPDNVMDVFSKLKEVGFSISIDDFGTGYSSLSYLNRLGANSLKIDKSFIDSLLHDPHEQTIVKSIIELGHNLGLSVIAEGVETKEQLDYLRQFECDIAQGYFFDKPLTPDKLFPLGDYQSKFVPIIKGT